MIDLAQLEDRLLNLPNEIFQQERKVILAKEKMEMAKIEFDAKYAFALLQAIKPNATEKKAEATVMTKDAKMEMMKASLEFERQNAILKAKEAEFTALRKVGSIETELLKTQLSGN